MYLRCISMCVDWIVERYIFEHNEWRCLWCFTEEKEADEYVALIRPIFGSNERFRKIKVENSYIAFIYEYNVLSVNNE